MVNERTPLTPKVNENFAFLMRRRTRQFQCCAGAFFLAIIIITVTVISVAYIESPNEIDDLNESIRIGSDALEARDNLELNMTVLQSNSPSYRHQMSTATSKIADKIARNGYAIYYSSKWLSNKKNPELLFQSKHAKDLLKKTGWCNPHEIKNCTKSRYRSINGTCNNLDHPNDYGVAFTKFRRLLPPAYEDGIGEPRGGLNSNYLPPASLVSNTVHRPTYKDDVNFTVMLAVWGQFMDHDVTATALSRGKNGQAISCCSNFKSKNMHPECFPVLEEIQTDNWSCTDFVRSAPAGVCNFGPREQMNQITAFIDGSVVYGSESGIAKKLRTFKNGFLDMITTSNGRHLLPASKDDKDGCNRQEMINKERYCFLSGDARANENLHLTTMHLLWARQHNRVAIALSEINPHWDDEKLYQESKHIIAAQIQHITYSEFLPIVLGIDTTKKYDLVPQNNSYYQGYDPNLDPTISNSFAAAAFRFAHTLIPGLIRSLGKNQSNEEYIRLHEMLFNPFRLYDNELDDVIAEAIRTPIEAADPFFTNELKQHLFERKLETLNKKPCGLDLVALNIQRGRDHGLPNYTAWRKFCNLTVPNNFQDLVSYIDEESVKIIANIYSNITDIDLYTGALSEKPLKGGLVGPTASCIIIDQFIRLKKGDRFWYETPEKPQAFTLQQLNEIRLSTLAEIICENGDSIISIPKYVMLGLNHTQNQILPCTEISSINFSYWKEN